MDPKELEFPQEKEGWGPKARPKGSLSSQKKKFFMLTIFWIAGTRSHTHCITSLLLTVMSIALAY